MRQAAPAQVESIPTGQHLDSVPQLWTADDLWLIPDDLRCELIRGGLIRLSPAGHHHGSLTVNVGAELRFWNKQAKAGCVYGAETGFILERDPDTVRAPDSAFVRNERLVESEQGFFPGPPDLAVEVVSPDQSHRFMLDKIAFWLDHGTQVVWVVWPKTKTLSVHQHPPGHSPTQDRREDSQVVVQLDQTQTLDGGELLPGFQCKVSELFD